MDPTTLLDRLKRSLHSLNERRAKYGIDAPASLILEIEDHEKAVVLTQQLADNKLTETQWRDALHPLLVSIQDRAATEAIKDLNLGGVTFSNIINSNITVGDINTEVNFSGDVVFGDKITNVYEPPPPAQARERRDLGILLKNVETTWIKGVLEHSLYNAVLLELGKESRADAVEHPWQRVMEIPGRERHVLPPEKAIKVIYEEANRLLLILGEPGSGKTTTLLELARDLIAEVKQDLTFTQPIPVIFNLSTWTKQQSLADWLVGELNSKYLTPKKQGRRWLEERRILPLLDGLDEVKAEHRAACVEQINRLAADVGLQGVVVCSRMKEYAALDVRLGFVGAIYLLPLTPDQIDEYLGQAGAKLAGLRGALQQDSGQREMAQSPLMLNIMSLAYQNVSAAELDQPELNTDEAHRSRLFDTYITRMFKRKGNQQFYDPKQTKRRLAWLARNMQRHNQEVFLIEGLQPSWLSARLWRIIYILTSRLGGALFFGLFFGLLFGLSMGSSSVLVLPIYYGRNYGLMVNLISGIIGGMTTGLILGLLFGLSGGLSSSFIDVLRFEWLGERSRNKGCFVYLGIVVNIVCSGLIFGLFTGLLVGLINDWRGGLFVGLNIGLFFGLSVGLIFGLKGSQQSFKNDVRPVEALRWSWRKALKGGLLAGLIGGLLVWLLFGLGVGLIVGLSEGLHNGLARGWGVGRLEGVFAGVIFGSVGAIIRGLSREIVKVKMTPNQGIILSAKNTIFASLIIMLTSSLIGWLNSGWNGWITRGPIFALINGLVFGSFFGALGGLSGALWYGGLDIIQHYTLRLILTIQGHTPLNYARFLDYAAERIFLQKVGGGYRFIHRLMLEHFAAMEVEK
ncbi:MAG: NACHT domain-containing protein [Anaerolineae bacterium]|nr:NACHT domain-containing protein [Anaerolineae bacterium]